MNMEMPGTITSTTYRWHIAIAHSAVILWQAYIAILAFRSGDVLEKLLAGLGAKPGPGVTLFLATHHWWIVVPVAFTILAALAVRRLEERPMFSAVTLAAGVIAALALNVLWREAWFGPIFSLIRQVG